MSQKLTVDAHFGRVAYEDLDPLQRSAWDAFWSGVIRRVSKSCRPQPAEAKVDHNTRRRCSGAALIEDYHNDNTSGLG
jgi:hypothetical protein